MKKKVKYDFVGYATKYDVLCTDGRTIKPGAFNEMNGKKVPLVWSHQHDGPENVLGHGVLQVVEDGVKVYALFNGTPQGLNSKDLVVHGDIDSLSIWANNLIEKPNGKKTKDVYHGVIREVSLVFSGANSEAQILNLDIMHGDQMVTDMSEAIITFGDRLMHENVELEIDDDPVQEKVEKDAADLEHSENKQLTAKEVFETLSEQQKTVVYAMIGEALDTAEEPKQSDDGGKNMKHNVFDKSGSSVIGFTKEQFAEIIHSAMDAGNLKGSDVIAHAAEFGIDQLEVLLPDAQTSPDGVQWLQNPNEEWINVVLAGVSKLPFSRIKTIIGDMNYETARAKGYVKGTDKKEIYLKFAKRQTTPTTVYAKQKLDHDDVIDITEFQVTAMMYRQIRQALLNELALCYLLGDGRDLEDPDKVDEENIRPIWKESDLFAQKVLITSNADYKKMVKEMAEADDDYKGSGSPTLFMPPKVRTGMLWIEDATERRIYMSEELLRSDLGVSKIVTVPLMSGKTRTLEDGSVRELIGIKLNLKDYKTGSNKAGQIGTYEDFDIDFNQHKYLIETRVAAALDKPYAAQIFEYEVTPPTSG